MKIIEWNINQRSNCKNKNNIPNFISDEIHKQEVDIIILTEFYKVSDWIEFVNKLAKYNVFYTDNGTDKGIIENEILIAVRKDILVKRIIPLKSTKDNTNPNFLRVDIKYKEKDLTIIGVRIRDSRGDQAFLDNQHKIFNEEIKKVSKDADNVVILGDFNAREKFIKDKSIKETDYTIHHSSYGSYSFVFNNGGRAQIDHLIYRGRGIKVESVDNYWDFTKCNKLVYQHIHNDGGIENPFPDHAILIVNIE